MNQAAFTAIVHGIVQGVGFRYFTLRKGKEYELTGYVRNLPDGTVETYAEGNREVLEQFLSDLRRGPAGSVVDRVTVEWTVETKNYSTFSITF